MDPRILQLLEFPKVLRHISTFAISEAGRDACLLLLPETDLSRIAERSCLIEELLRFSGHTEIRLLPTWPEYSRFCKILWQSSIWTV